MSKKIALTSSITKAQLITLVAKKLTNWLDKDIEIAVNEIIEYLIQALSKGERIEIRGFGSFALRYRKSRQAHNPKTGAKVVTKPAYAIHFKPGKELRALVNNAGKPADADVAATKKQK